MSSTEVLCEVKGDSHQIWRTQRVQVNVASLRLFLRSSTGPNRAFEPQSLGRVRDPVRIAEGPTDDFGFSILDYGLRTEATRVSLPEAPARGERGADGATHSLVPAKRGWPPMSSLGMMLPPPGKAADRKEDRHAGCRIVPSRPRCPPPPCRRRGCGRHPGKPGGLPRARTGRDDVPGLRLPERPGGRFPLHRGGMGAEGRASANASASDALGDPA